MRILITGAAGNLGRGLTDRLLGQGRHRLVLSDLVPPPGLDDTVEFHQLDLQIGAGLETAARDCDLLVHLPAWHGVHSGTKTETDFWRLNVDGTFWALQAARANGIRRCVFLSSQSWHGHYEKYGFTKRIGEELLAYHHARHGLSYVAVRPHDFTPWSENWPQRYGVRLLHGGVDRDDVLDAVLAAIDHVQQTDDAELVLDATRPNVFTADQLQGWEHDPAGTLEPIFPGAAEAVQRYRLDISQRPTVAPDAGRAETGYAPSRHFGSFLERLMALQPDEARDLTCPY
ncbi:NAD-dependent epimerase/dehydratase family protein [Microlunatus soli]|uniref:Nucleoside-diphosphate-sugar epimerase n=1 Tax=Microlunatus soli TaxID=630515 RepID=A0A1H1VFM4_9ACTN|nr:NAD(P)-dependent oxidoreductase [Microlunatus soli]SDS83475.1 Nucleoside-diphosphate-sugar epimerase [Microlunatus soli]